MSPASFSRAGPCLGAAFPPQGPGDSVPLLPRYYAALRRPAALPHCSFRRASFPRSAGTTNVVEATGTPKFLGDLKMNVPRSRTPVGQTRPALGFDASTWPSAPFDGVGSHNATPFGAQSRGPLTRCLRFAAPGLPSGPRKTRFRLEGCPYPDGVFLPARSLHEVSTLNRYIVSSSSKHLGAPKGRVRGDHAPPEKVLPSGGQLPLAG